MDIRDDQNHVFNTTLAKYTGLYQMLDPQTKRFRGLNVYHFVLAFIITLYMGVMGMIMNVSGVYYWTDNIPLGIDYIWKGMITVYTIYPMCIIVYYSNDIWNCLSITFYGLTSRSLRDRHILNRWRKRSVLLTIILAVTYLLSVVIYFVSSQALSNGILSVKNRKGLVSNYHYNVINLYLFVSDETYNAYYYMFYIVETLYIVSTIVTTFLFDFLLVTLCLATRCQMEMICTAFESVGHKLFGDDLSLVGEYGFSDCRDEKKKLPNEHDLIYDEIKTIITDHQVVMKKYDVFLTIFNRVVLLEIVVFSLTFIMLCICFVMSFSNDDRFKSSRIFTIKTFCVIPLNVSKLFALYYLFGNSHDQKDSIIFALYSSNWTEMDMKCKKIILSTMKMNNANHKKLKFTRTKIVNLEMFFKTMRDSYSILSVLVNYIKNMDE